MIRFSKGICVSIIFISLLISFAASGTPKDKPSTLSNYNSSQHEGVIGTTEESPVDNPVDNIFHVNVNEALCGEEKVWLVYDLEGVQDHTSVSRSINDQLSVGGYLIKRRRGWATQREQISPAWLQQGDNIVRFTTPENSTHSYKIKNLRFEVESLNPTNDDIQIIINQPSGHYYFGKAYIKGLITGAGSGKVKINVAGKTARVYSGEFESIIDFENAQSSCTVEIEAVHPDGTTTCYSINFEEPLTPDFVYGLNTITHRTEKFFQINEAATISLQGALLTTPAEAVKASSLLSITTLRDIDIPALDGGMVNVTKNHAGFRFLPHGTTFLKEAKLTIPFDATKIPDGYTEKDIKTYYFDEQAHHWIAVSTDTVLMETGLVVSSTTHFTDYINAIIKVPESPEAEAYNSTSMKGIKAANPTAAVNLINPPQANNTGNASLGYPINIPAGRSGMQPQLGINYNSGGGNGWMGLGWNLTIPSISIDTRWGVPRYDAANETETYSMNGEMLSPVAHRGPLQSRSSEKQFYPRVEGGFSKIIRHGNNPADYWWEVTDKSGTRYFYGGSPAGFDKNTVLRTDEANADESKKGNIAQWCLSEVRDLNGNTVKYHYTKVPDTGLVGGTVPGYQIYIDKITYTGHNGSDGKYAVLFTRDRELGEARRTDVSIMANLGFKQVTADLLRKIEVQFENKNIRSYELKYKPGEFYKTLLNTISEFDAAGTLFNTHTLEYFNDVKTGSVLTPFKAEATWSVPKDDINGGLIVSKLGFDDNASVLSGNKTTDFGFGLTVTVGANDTKLTSKSNTLGGSFGYSQSDTNGKLLLIDINGDGLPDKVMTDGNGFRYRPNLSKPGGEQKFGNPIAMINVGEFYKDRSKTLNVGFEAQGGFGDNASAFVGVGGSKTTTVTSIYFTDVNGDQLPDLVKNGMVYFNTINKQTGVITFEQTSINTPSPIVSSRGIAGSIFQVDQQEVDDDIKANPLHDVVRMWRVPESGKINISSTVALADKQVDAPNADGVITTIQLNGGLPLFRQQIAANDFKSYPASLSNVTVTKGDRIYFRVQSIFNGEADEVKWSPVIEYVDKDLKRKDANGKIVYHFDASKDFVLTSPMEVTAPIDGRIRIDGQFEKPLTTDSVHVEIIRHTETGDILEFDETYSWDEKVNKPISLEVNVTKEETFNFKITSATNIDWPAIHWKPRLFYIASADPNVTELQRDGKPVISYDGVPQLSVFPRVISETKHWTVNENVDSLVVEPTLTFKTVEFPNVNLYNGPIMFSVKKKDTLVFRKKIIVLAGVILSPKSYKIPVAEGDSLYFEFHSELESLAEGMRSHKTKIKFSQKDSVVEAGVYTQFQKKEDFIFGTLYRNWGQFAYNGNGSRADEVIHEGDLRLSEKLEREYKKGDVSSTDELKNTGAYDPAKENFIMMMPRGIDRTWAGYDEFTYVDGDRISSSRMGDDDLSAVKAFEQGPVVVRGINKISKSLSASLSGGVAVPGVNASANTSIGSSRVLADFVDMNGDRYPDIMTEKGIQFTTANGDLEENYRTFVTGNIQQTSTNASGASVGGPVKIKAKGSATNAQAAKSDVGGAKVSGTISANYGKGDNTGKFAWQDINGDGLPDRVFDDGMAQLNLGYKLTAPEPWAHGSIQVSQSTSVGGGLGFVRGQGSESPSLSGGIGLSRSDNDTWRSLQDINGDGLTDELILGGSVWDAGISGGVKVRLNTGAGFSTTPIDWLGAPKISEGSTTGESANLSFTGCIPLVLVKICINPSGNIGRSMSRDKSRISDMDGDGFPDYLVSANDGDLKVKRSTIGRTNMLKSVKRPLGANFSMDYARLGNTYDLPNTVWALTQVKVFDGFKGDGVDSLMTTFAYEGGKYDRHEREFYGFKKVITQSHDTEKSNKPVYTQVTQTFSNDNYYEKGLLLTEVMTDGAGLPAGQAGNKFVEKENTYAVSNVVADVKFPAMTATSQKFYEGQSSPGKSTSMAYGYDAIGNVVSYNDFGDEGDDDDLSAAITYHDIADKYIKGTPKSITVTGNGTTYRKRESVIDPQTGNIKQIKQYLSDSEVAVHDLEYDSYGNLTRIARPKNSKDQRMGFDYEYDTKVFTYTTKVSNSYGYSSEAVYDFRYGQVLSSKDLNGNKITYELDDLGRVKNITGPYEKGGASKTIEFEYHPEATVPWALTNHYDPANPKNKLQTSIFVDGLGRVLQTKKDVALYAGEGKADTGMMTVSGRVKFDAFGRTISALYPVTEAIGTQGAFNTTEDTVLTCPGQFFQKVNVLIFI